MVLHLQKLCVGVDDPDHLRRLQTRWAPILEPRFGPGRAGHITRHAPKRAAELLAGGSLYWVIRGVMCLRQRLIGFEPWSRALSPWADAEGQGDQPTHATLILLDAAAVPVQARPCRAFQGWRYLAAEQAPLDLNLLNSRENLPPALAAELGRLGLL